MTKGQVVVSLVGALITSPLISNEPRSQIPRRGVWENLVEAPSMWIGMVNL